MIRTTAINKILKLSSRKKIVQGGSSAGKTYAIITILIDKATRTPNLEISVVSESIPHLKRGALKDFIKIMKETNRWVEERYNATDRIYRFANGSYIEFFSPESILGARRNILYVNEANNISYEDYYQLAVRTSHDIYLDFNPVNEFWAHTEVLQESDSEMIILNYLDNEALPPNVIKDFDNALIKADLELEQGVKGYWTNWCKVYIYGEVGSLMGTVFQFNIVSSIPINADFIAYGLDWGFSKDPTALIAVYKYNGELYCQELIYEIGLTNADLIAKMNELNVHKGRYIIADSAEPKSIEDLIRGGYTLTQPSKKGQDSIRNSIDTLQQFKINITQSSVNMINEFRSYRWETDKSGKETGSPIDAFNHTIDPLRYVALNKINKSSGKFDYEIVGF